MTKSSSTFHSEYGMMLLGVKFPIREFAAVTTWRATMGMVGIFSRIIRWIS